MMTPNDVRKLVEQGLREIDKISPYLKEVKLIGSQAERPDEPVRPFHDVDLLIVFKKDSPRWVRKAFISRMNDATFNWDASMKDTLLAPVSFKGLYANMAYTVVGLVLTQLMTQMNFFNDPEQPVREAVIVVDAFIVEEGWEMPESWKDTPLKKKWRTKRKEIFRKSVLLSIIGGVIPGFMVGVEMACRMGYKLEKRLSA